jgi:hypothetical protein
LAAEDGGRHDDAESGGHWRSRYDPAVQVLGSLLPGVREVRAPLAAGYTWLFVAWLLYGSDASQHPTGVALDLKRLHETVSTAGAAVAVGFVAYMIGVFSIAAANILSDRAARLLRPLTGAWLRWRHTHSMQRRTPWWFSDYAPRTAVALKTLVVPQMEETGAALNLAGRDDSRPGYEQLADLVAPIVRRPAEGRIEEAVTEGVADEFEQMGRQLIGREPELFGEYDRLRAEAELRASLVLPGAALGATLVWIGGGGWRSVGAAVIVAAVLLVPLAKARNHDAIDVVVSALRDGRVDSPVLVRLKQETERIKGEAEAAAPPVDAADAIPAADTDHP